MLVSLRLIGKLMTDIAEPFTGEVRYNPELFDRLEIEGFLLTTSLLQRKWSDDEARRGLREFLEQHAGAITSAFITPLRLGFYEAVPALGSHDLGIELSNFLSEAKGNYLALRQAEVANLRLFGG